MERVLRLKHWAIYGPILVLVALGVFVFISTVTSGDSGVSPQSREDIRSEYHGKEGGLGDFWSVKCVDGSCKPKPQEGRRSR